MIKLIRFTEALKKLQISEQLKKIFNLHVTSPAVIIPTSPCSTERNLFAPLPLDTVAESPLGRELGRSVSSSPNQRESQIHQNIPCQLGSSRSHQKRFCHGSSNSSSRGDARVSVFQTTRESDFAVISSKNARQVSSEGFSGKMASIEEKNCETENCEKLKMKAASSSATASTSCNGNSESSSVTDIVKFLELVGSLKHLKRTGWVMRNVKDCESVSGHMYRMSMITFLLDENSGLNRTKCMEMALVHDLAECVVGDITPFCGVSREEKKLREIRAMEEICKLIQPFGKRMLELFLEYEAGESPESKYVKDLDRLDMLVQAFEYEKRDNCFMKHQEFFDSVDGKFEHPFVKNMAEEVKRQREILASGGSIETNGVPEIIQNGYTNGHHEQENSDINGITEKKASSS